MSNYRRVRAPGGVYFFTVVTQDRSPLLVTNIDHLRRAFRIALRRRPAGIDAIVVLPDHLHCIWRLPPGDADSSVRWMTIKRLFSAALPARGATASRRERREKGIWQRRFWEHAIRDCTDWYRHMDYVHYNPVKHGLCAAPKDWPYGSFRRCVDAGLYPLDWGVEPRARLDGLVPE